MEGGQEGVTPVPANTTPANDTTKQSNCSKQGIMILCYCARLLYLMIFQFIVQFQAPVSDRVSYL